MIGTYNNNLNIGSLCIEDDDIIKTNKSEMKLFYELVDITIYNKNDTIVLDRLYFSNKLIEKCINKKINYSQSNSKQWL